jgi:Uncharacterized protein conserved in bacteria (DUF2252)
MPAAPLRDGDPVPGVGVRPGQRPPAQLAVGAHAARYQGLDVDGIFPVPQLASYLGGSDVFDQAITRFAAAYADQNERDHQALLDAVASGRLTAEPDM